MLLLKLTTPQIFSQTRGMNNKKWKKKKIRGKERECKIQGKVCDSLPTLSMCCQFQSLTFLSLSQTNSLSSNSRISPFSPPYFNYILRHLLFKQTLIPGGLCVIIKHEAWENRQKIAWTLFSLYLLAHSKKNLLRFWKSKRERDREIE